MKQETINLIDAINKEGLDNGTWGVCKDILNTAGYFGSKESVKLMGNYIYIYRYVDESRCFIDEEACGKPKHTLTIDDGFIDIYKL